MSNSNLEQDYDDNDQGNKPDPVRAQLKKVEALNKTLEAEAAAGKAAQRELVLIKAGIPTDTALGKLFAKAYEGELTVDVIKAAAIEATIIPDPANDPKLVAEQGAQERIAAARTAGEQTVAEVGLDVQIAEAKTPAELEAIVARANAGKSV